MASVEYVTAKSIGALKTEVDELLNSTSATYALSGGIEIDRQAVDSLFVQALAVS